MEDVIQSRSIKKQAQEVIFSKKTNKLSNPSVIFPVQHTSTQKYLGVYLDEKLNFNIHIREKTGKASKGTGVIESLYKRLRLGLSHLNEHKFNHNFDDCINPFCTCSLKRESRSHFFSHCHHYGSIRMILEDLNSVDKNLANLSDNELTKILLYQAFINYNFLCTRFPARRIV